MLKKIIIPIFVGLFSFVVAFAAMHVAMPYVNIDDAIKGVIKIVVWIISFVGPAAYMSWRAEMVFESRSVQDADSGVKVFRRSIWWKVYFFFITIALVFGTAPIVFDPHAGISEYIDFIVFVFATVGLYSFVFLRPIFNPSFWLSVFLVDLIYSVVYIFVANIDLGSGGEFYAAYGVGVLLYLPTYWSLFALSRPTDPAWSLSNKVVSQADE